MLLVERGGLQCTYRYDKDYTVAPIESFGFYNFLLLFFKKKKIQRKLCFCILLATSVGTIVNPLWPFTRVAAAYERIVFNVLKIIQ